MGHFSVKTSALNGSDLGDIQQTMVIVTHEMAFAADVANRVVFMDGGQVVAEGTPDEIIRNPEIERLKTFLARFHA